MSQKVVVVGGGFGGCAAAAVAARAGAEVTLVEKTDTLTGLGQLAGSFRRGGAFTVHDELIAMGAGDIPKALDSEVIFRKLEPQDPNHFFLYDGRRIGRVVDGVLRGLGIKVIYRGLATDVEMSGKQVKAVRLKDGTKLEADAVVDATGATGPIDMCEKYGRGCVSCVMMCPTFGGRVSISAKAGVKEFAGLRADGTPGTFTAGISFCKESLSREIQQRLEKEGEFRLPAPAELVDSIYQKMKLLGPSLPPEHAKVIELVYVGYVNIVGIPFLAREEIEKIPGFENAIFVSPYAAWVGNAIRYVAIAPRDSTMKVEGVDNLFVAGEKAGGQLVGVTPGFATGTLAGYNAVRKAAGMELLQLPRTTATGAYIAYTAEHQNEQKTRYSLTRGPAVNHLNELGLYTTDIKKINNRIKELGLAGIFSKKLA